MHTREGHLLSSVIEKNYRTSPGQSIVLFLLLLFKSIVLMPERVWLVILKSGSSQLTSKGGPSVEAVGLRRGP